MSRRALPISAFAILVAIITTARADAGPKWQIAYFYDKLDSELQIRDFQCPSPHRCLAVGDIAERTRRKPVEILSNDDGAHWTVQDLKEVPTAVFFLNDQVGWMASDKNIWHTSDSGQTWTKLQKLEGIGTIYFLDAQRGFAAGLGAYATMDGGQSWRRISAGGDPKSGPLIAYTDIAFSGSAGYIIGSGVSAPAWLNPERARLNARQSKDNVILKTADAGVTWTRSELHSEAGLVRLVLTSPTKGFAIFRFSAFDEAPSGVYALDLASGQKSLAYTDKGRLITDLHILGKRIIAAGIQLPGKLSDVPVPGKVRVVFTDDTTTWLDMDVDYRAVARQVLLAGTDLEHMLLATDTGMILKFTEYNPDQKRP